MPHVVGLAYLSLPSMDPEPSPDRYCTSPPRRGTTSSLPVFRTAKICRDAPLYISFAVYLSPSSCSQLSASSPPPFTPPRSLPHTPYDMTVSLKSVIPAIRRASTCNSVKSNKSNKACKRKPVRRALIVGIMYRNKTGETLLFPHKDAQAWRDILIGGSYRCTPES